MSWWITRYHAWAFGLELWAGSDTVLHINAGLALWLIGALVLRRPLRSAWTLAPVLLAEGGNELFDYLAHVGWSLGDTIHDIASTLFWPVLLQQALARGRR